MAELNFLDHVRSLILAAAENPAPPLASLSVEEVRAARNPVLIDHLGPPEPVAGVEDLPLWVKDGEITLRVYTPKGPGPFPGLVYFHGGGWVVGNLETHDSLCRALANAAACVVVAVDYRLSPEHKFPVAVEDAFSATLWAAENSRRLNCLPGALAVAGDSAGGGLAASVCLLARDRGGPELKLQLLVYPVTDLSSFDRPSYRDYWDKLILTGESMGYFREAYLARPEDGLDPLASPLLAESLAGLPPALVITAEHDVLTSDGQEYAARLKKAGVKTACLSFPGTIHLFFGMAALNRRENGLEAAARALRQALAS